MNMIIGKKQIVLAALVVALGTAIFLNWKFTDANGGTNVAGVFNASSTLGASTYVSASGSSNASSASSAAASTSSGKASSSSKATSSASGSSSSAASGSLFAQERLTRTTARAQAEQALQITLNSATATAEEKQTAQTQIDGIANNITSEGNIEGLVVSKGFKDCVCFINNGAVSIVVAPKGNQTLSTSDSAQVADIVMQQAKVSADNIKIIQSK